MSRHAPHYLCLICVLVTLAIGESFTSFTDMRLYSSMPIDIQSYAIDVLDYYGNLACDFSPTKSDIYTAACYQATPSLASSFFESITDDPFSVYDTDLPTQGKTSVADLWDSYFKQPAVTSLAEAENGGETHSVAVPKPSAGDGSAKPSETATSSSKTSSSSPSSTKSGESWSDLTVAAQVFTILGPIIAVVLAGIGAFYAWRRRQKHKEAAARSSGIEMSTKQDFQDRSNGGRNDLANPVLGNHNQTGNQTIYHGNRAYYRNDRQNQPASEVLQARGPRNPLGYSQRLPTTSVDDGGLGTGSNTSTTPSASTFSARSSLRQTGNVRDV